MIPVWALAVLAFGLNFGVWGLIGLLRLADARMDRRRKQPRQAGSAAHRAWRQTSLVSAVRPLPMAGSTPTGSTPTSTASPAAGPDPTPEPGHLVPRAIELGEVAVLMAAHNEEVVLRESLQSISRLIPAWQVHVVSDASTDATLQIARQCGVNAVQTPSNVGKAGALDYGITAFDLPNRYRAVLFLDADTRLDPAYFDRALPLFDDPQIVAVAGFAASDWDRAEGSLLTRLLIAHRSRLYELTQRLLKYGQTWRRTNVTHIVPGFASMYRTDVLDQIDINPGGLVIEDFNMTFEVYRRGLGKVGFTPGAVAVTQDPDTLGDYVRQMRRWSLGLWQTVRRHGPRADRLTAMLVLLLGELLSASVFLLYLPLLLLALLIGAVLPGALETYPALGTAHFLIAGELTWWPVVLAVLLPDVCLSVLMAVLARRPAYLWYWWGYLPMRMIDAGIALRSLVASWRTSSTGRWVSPARRQLAGPQRTSGVARAAGTQPAQGVELADARRSA